MRPLCPSFPPYINATKILTHPILWVFFVFLHLHNFSPKMEWTRGRNLGRGSSAVVSLATSSSGNVFAVKSCELSKSETQQNEQRFLTVLSSPYLVSYKGSDITRENKTFMYNLFLEYASRGTIIDAISDTCGGLIKEPMIAHYTRHIVHGLEYLHSNGVVHCDIKGSNILVGEGGAKIADLGCAKWAENLAAPLVGTPMYMAPEVARGEEQGFAADIWALGCTVIEMATGVSPWPNNVNDHLQILYRIAFSGELPEFPSSLSDQAKDFLSKCLRRDQTNRWTAKELLDHPFIGESKRNQEFHTSSSPTSILDQDIWEANIINQVGPCSWSSSAAGERMEKLACSSGEAEWRWEETWMTIRSNDEEEGWRGGCGCGPGTVWDGDGMDVHVEFNVSGNKNLMMGWCTCVKNSVGVGCLINFQRCNVPLLDHQSHFL